VRVLTSHNHVVKDSCLVDCDALSLDVWLPKFQTNTLHSSSEAKQSKNRQHGIKKFNYWPFRIKALNSFP
jgi:hypothetical protein